MAGSGRRPARWVEAWRNVMEINLTGNSVTPGTPGRGCRPDQWARAGGGPDNGAVREWAQANGLKVGAKGIPRAIRQAYEATAR